MKISLKYLSLCLALNFLASCGLGGFKLNYDDDTALIEAVEKGDLEMVRHLSAKNHIDVNTKTSYNCSGWPIVCSPLHWAAYKGHTEIARLLLDRGASVDCRNDFDYTPLLYATRYGHQETVRLLLNRGASVDCKTTWGFTPLHWAVYRHHLEIVRLLLEKNARFDIKNKHGEKPFDPEFSRIAPKETLLLAAVAGRVDLVQDILDNNINLDINTQDENGDTALILAARNGHLSVVEVLIGRGANKNRQNKNKQTALEAAIEHRRRTITLELIKNNNSLDAKNKKGQTALMIAIETRQEEVAKALIKARADLNCKDNNNQTALYYARNGSGKNKEIENTLLKYGAEEYLLSKKIKKGAKSLLFKAAEKAPEVGAAVLL